MKNVIVPHSGLYFWYNDQTTKRVKTDFQKNLNGLPIFQCIKNEEFIWGNLQAEAFENYKFIITLLVSPNHYDSNKILLITSDASQVSMNASYFNYSPETGELVLIDTQIKLFSKSELNYSPVAKESRAFMYALSYGENLIRNN